VAVLAEALSHCLTTVIKLSALLDLLMWQCSQSLTHGMTWLPSLLIMASALFNPETSISIQKRHPYTGNLNSETSGDSQNAFLHCGDVSATLKASMTTAERLTADIWWESSSDLCLVKLRQEPSLMTWSVTRHYLNVTKTTAKRLTAGSLTTSQSCL